FLSGMLAAPAPAQGPQVEPNVPQPRTTTQATSNVVAVPAYQPPPIVNVNGYAPSYGYYPSSPYGSYLSGKADLVNASGQYGIQVQQANLLQEQVHQSMLQSRRAVLNEARYERETTMNSEQVRIQGQIDALRRARNEPPLNEIWSGQSLNALFSDIKKAHTYGVRGPSVPINQDLLKHINLTTGVTSGGPGILKDGAKLRWAVVLQGPNFEADRRKVEMRTAEALELAKRGPVSLDLISDVRSTLEGMQATLKQMVKDVAPGPYIDGKKYLRELDSSFSALKDPNVSNYFNGKWTAQGATVYDLAVYMTNNGLQFAPAVSGDQSYYTALYQSLLS
ncbi:MAG: hypothetical protein ACREDY_11455, partial [Bradyrhizobium sp.]